MSEQAFLVQLALLERDGELAAVDELIEAVFAGGRLVAIEGPPGIGKTALMIETKRLGQAAGLRASSRAAPQRTVEVHLTSIYRKLEINSRLQLAAALGEPAGV